MCVERYPTYTYIYGVFYGDVMDVSLCGLFLDISLTPGQPDKSLKECVPSQKSLVSFLVYKNVVVFIGLTVVRYLTNNKSSGSNPEHVILRSTVIAVFFRTIPVSM